MQITNYYPDSDLVVIEFPGGERVTVSKDEHGETHIHAIDAQDNQRDLVLGEYSEED